LETVPRQRSDERARDQRTGRVEDTGRQRDAANGHRRSGERDRQRDTERRQPEQQRQPPAPAAPGELRHDVRGEHSPREAVTAVRFQARSRADVLLRLMTCSFVRTDGIIPFVVGKDGRVYEKDLGKKTDRIAQAMKTYEPEGPWKP